MSDPIEEVLTPPPTVENAVNVAIDTAKSTIEWAGVKVTVPPNLEEVDPDALEAIENGKTMTFLRLVIGSDEYDRARVRFKARYKRPATLRDVAGDENVDSEASNNSLAAIVSKHFGFETPGE